MAERRYYFSALFLVQSFRASLVLLLGQIVFESTTCYKCTSSVLMANQTGDVVIAGLFPVHYYDSNKKDYVINEIAFTWIEAFHFAVHKINSNRSILPGLTLGYVIRDSCNDQEMGLRHTLDFILNSNFSETHKEVYRAGKIGSTRGKCRCTSHQRSKVMSVIGGAASLVSAAVANLLGVEHLPQISYSSTSVDLSNKHRYQSFLRTIPPDSYQAKAIADYLKHFNWTYVSVLASDDSYGRLGLHELRHEFKMRHMCMATTMTFNRSMPAQDVADIISNLKDAQRRNANVVVLWCQINEAKTILKKASSSGLEKLTWIGTESWGSNTHLFELGEIADGVIGLKPTFQKERKFERYLTQFSSIDFTHNPWLMKYLQKRYKCSTHSNSLSSQHSRQHINMTCDNQNEAEIYLRGLPRNKYPQVMSAVYAVAYGLHSLLGCNQSKCLGNISEIQPVDLRDEIMKTNFILPGSDMKVNFDKNGDISFASYTFTKLSMNFKVFLDIGDWKSEKEGLRIFKEQTLGGDEVENNISSQCSSPCKPGHHKILDKVPCCWKCALCGENHVSKDGMLESCTPCRGNWIADATKTHCVPLRGLSFTSFTPLRLVIAVVSMCGVILTAFITTIFLKNWETPVIKSSNRELTMLQLCFIGILFCYPALYFWKPSVPACMTRYLCLALFSTTVISVIFVKTYRLWKIFNLKSTGVSAMLKNTYQPVYVVCLVLVQLMIYGFWRLYQSNVVSVTIDMKNKTQLQHCSKYEETLLLIFISYVFCMALASAFMAFRVRTLPDIFNEARFISFSMFIYCLLWVLYIPLYFTFKADVITQAEILCSINTITNLALLLTLHGNKIRITLFYPERNTRDYFQRHTAMAVFRRSLLPDAINSSGPSTLCSSTPPKMLRSASEKVQVKRRASYQLLFTKRSLSAPSTIAEVNDK